jgi:hypothetical protein
MTRRHCMLMLLSLGALTLRECYEITGWPRHIVRRVIAGLVACGKVLRLGHWGKGIYFL